MKIEKEYTYDYVHGTNVYIYQAKKMFRMNTDTSLLTHFMVIKEGERVLDIGTNNGALLAVANTFAPSFLYGIEIQEDAYKLACFNMEKLNIKQYKIICADVKQVVMPSVDVVVCNPPYFKVNDTNDINVLESLAIARHEKFLQLEDVAKKASEALAEKGRLYLVHRANRISDVIFTLRENNLEIKTLQFVYDKCKEEAVSVLVEAIKYGKVNAHIKPAIFIDR